MPGRPGGSAAAIPRTRRDATLVRRLGAPETVDLPVSAGRHLIGVGPSGAVVRLG